MIWRRNRSCGSIGAASPGTGCRSSTDPRKQSAGIWSLQSGWQLRAAIRPSSPAEVVLSLKKQYLGLKLIAVVPFQGVEARWDKLWISRFYSLLHQADLVKTICDKYSPDAYQKRNKWMIDHSNRVIAVFNGEPSGTKQVIDYALKKAVPVELLSA